MLILEVSFFPGFLTRTEYTEIMSSRRNRNSEQLSILITRTEYTEFTEKLNSHFLIR